MSPKAIDLFAGVGGLSLGFEMAGFDVLLAVEYDKSIADAYKLNHPKTKMLIADIRELPLEKTFSEFVGKIDVVFGGPPCQGFSQKGQRKTINDERNFLFKYFVSAVTYLRPQYFVMENVPNLLTTEQSYFKKEIETLFEKHGYYLSTGVLNAADYGVPQNRRRAVIIGKREEAASLLPKPLDRQVTIWEAISDLAYLNSGEGSETSEYRMPAESSYQKNLRKGSKTLYNHISTRHSALAIKRLQMIPPNSGKEVLPEEHLTKSIYSGTWTRMGKDEISVTITTRFDTPSSGKFTHPYLHRAITVREAARIQSFPDKFRFIGTKSSQMKQVGNAVPPLLAYAIAKAIMDDYTSQEEKK
jgi:DNA (cytosine-5)-methyltransferase 1